MLTGAAVVTGLLSLGSFLLGGDDDAPPPTTAPSASSVPSTDTLDDPDIAGEPLVFTLAPSTCSILECNDETRAVFAGTEGFTPNARVDVRIITPGGIDANDIGGSYTYNSALESTSSGTVRFSYWWKKGMDTGGYLVRLTDRATERSVSDTLTFTAPDLKIDRLVSDFVCDYKPGDESRVLATISQFAPNEPVRYEIDPLPTDPLRVEPADEAGTKTITWYCEERFAPRVVTYTVHALETGREVTFRFNYVRPEDAG